MGSERCLMALALVAGPAGALGAQDEPCSDDRGEERCTRAACAAQREIYGVPPIEELTRQRVEMVRAFYVDGYGRDLLMLALSRRGDQAITVEVRVPNDDKASIGTSLTPRQWREVAPPSKIFKSTKPAPSDAESMVICMHGWMATVEAADARGRIRTITQSACHHDDGAVDYALSLTEAVLPSLAGCAKLDPAYSRNEATLLATCAQLAGNRAVAAEAWNALNAADAFSEPGALRKLFVPAITASWPGQAELSGAEAVGDALSRAFGGDDLYWDEIAGEAGDQARVGIALYAPPSEDEDVPWLPKARLDLDFARQSDGMLRIVRIGSR